MRDLFLASLKGDTPELYADVKSTELEYFDRLVAKFQVDEKHGLSQTVISLTTAPQRELHIDGTPGGQLQMSSIINHLTHAHNTPAKAEAIQSAAVILETLIISRAHFPFSSPTPLTKEAFCRATIMLSDRCIENFKSSIIIGRDYVVSKRTNRKRLLFIYSALASPPTGKLHCLYLRIIADFGLSVPGMPTHDDVLDTVCRVRYPWRYYSKPNDEPVRHPVTEFLPLAKRLEPLQDAKLPVSISTPHPLRDLVAAFPPRRGRVPTDLSFENGGTVDAEQFVLWAKKVCQMHGGEMEGEH